MANRSQLRSGLRRLIQETVADQWTDDNLNEALNESLQSIQEIILMIDPEAFMVWQTRNITKDVRYYLRPTDIIWDVEFSYSDDPASKDYDPLDRVPFRSLRSDSGGRKHTEVPSDPNLQYAKVGAYHYLGWNPDKTIEDALQSVYVPWLTMDEDEDVPAISLGYHRMIKVDAAIKILQETPEDTTKLEEERAEFVEKLRRYYRSQAVTPDKIELDLGKSYG